jgi:hypothetical protein
MIDTAETDEELNKKEKYYIKYYKDLYGSQCYNLASGGDGGNVFQYQSSEQKQMFVRKMTKINQERCGREDFKQKIRLATIRRYQNENERRLHSEKVKAAWSDPELRSKQSDRLKEYYNHHYHDCSFNYIPCVFKLNNIEKHFESIKALR